MTYAEWKRLRRKFQKAGFKAKDAPAHDERGESVPLILRFSLDKKENPS